MDSWPMIQRCKKAQWWGLPPEQRDYLFQESERGCPMFISLGHTQYPLWSIERYERWSPYPLPARTTDYLICVKVDHWPDDFEPGKWGVL